MRQSSPPPSSSANPGESGSEPDLDFANATGYIPPVIADGPLDAVDPQASQARGASDLVPPELISQALGPTFQVIFHTIADQRGAHWELQAFEQKALVTGWTPIVQHLLTRLGNSEQVMLTLALASTTAIVGGKVFQDATKRALLTANTRMPESAASTAFSGSAAVGSQPVPGNSSEGQLE